MGPHAQGAPRLPGHVLQITCGTDKDTNTNKVKDNDKCDLAYSSYTGEAWVRGERVMGLLDTRE